MKMANQLILMNKEINILKIIKYFLNSPVKIILGTNCLQILATILKEIQILNITKIIKNKGFIQEMYLINNIKKNQINKTMNIWLKIFIHNNKYIIIIHICHNILTNLDPLNNIYKQIKIADFI